MPKPVLTRQQYVDLINSRYSQAEGAEPGAHAFLVPKGATGRQANGIGYSNNIATAGVFARVEAEIEAEYDVGSE